MMANEIYGNIEVMNNFIEIDKRSNGNVSLIKRANEMLDALFADDSEAATVDYEAPRVFSSEYRYAYAKIVQDIANERGVSVRVMLEPLKTPTKMLVYKYDRNSINLPATPEEKMHLSTILALLNRQFGIEFKTVTNTFTEVWAPELAIQGMYKGKTMNTPLKSRTNWKMNLLYDYYKQNFTNFIEIIDNGEYGKVNECNICNEEIRGTYCCSICNNSMCFECASKIPTIIDEGCVRIPCPYCRHPLESIW